MRHSARASGVYQTGRNGACSFAGRMRLEQLCRYTAFHALSDERAQCNAAREEELKLKTAWRDDTTHPVMSPLEFMRRLAALVPRSHLPAGNPEFTPLSGRFAEVNRASRCSAWGRPATAG